MMIIMSMWNKYPQTITPFISFFVMYYVILNLTVNIVDFFWNGLYKEITYHPDEDFASSFSFKTHQILMISLLSFVSGQISSPSIEYFKNYPDVLTFIFRTSIFVGISMFICFMAELTTMSPEKRFKVFRAELAKVFCSILLMYLESYLFT